MHQLLYTPITDVALDGIPVPQIRSLSLFSRPPEIRKVSDTMSRTMVEKVQLNRKNYEGSSRIGRTNRRIIETTQGMDETPGILGRIALSMLSMRIHHGHFRCEC